MRHYNVVSWILLILTAITFSLAAPALVQDKRRAYVDVVQASENVMTVLWKRMDDDPAMLWRYYNNVWRNRNPAAMMHRPNVPPVAPPNLAEVPEAHVPPPNPAEVHVPEVHDPPPNQAEVHVPEVHIPPPDPTEVHVPEVHAPPLGPADSDRQSMELGGGAPPGSPDSGPSHLPPKNP